MIYWVGKGQDPDGWMYKSMEEIEDETAMGRYSQETARKKLKKLGILEEKKDVRPGDFRQVLFFRIDIDALERVFSEWRAATSDVPGCGKPPTKDAEPPPGCGKPPTKVGVNQQPLYTESTTERTKKKEKEKESSTTAAPCAAPCGAEIFYGPKTWGPPEAVQDLKDSIISQILEEYPKYQETPPMALQNALDHVLLEQHVAWAPFRAQVTEEKLRNYLTGRYLCGTDAILKLDLFWNRINTRMKRPQLRSAEEVMKMSKRFQTLQSELMAVAESDIYQYWNWSWRCTGGSHYKSKQFSFAKFVSPEFIKAYLASISSPCVVGD
jgi:hypothetical protein